MEDDYGLQINLDRYMSLSTMNHTVSEFAVFFQMCITAGHVLSIQLL